MTITPALDPVTAQKIASLEKLARAYLAAEAAKSKRTDAELMRVALGSRPGLGSDVAHAAGALVAERTGALADWPAADVIRAAGTLNALQVEPTV